MPGPDWARGQMRLVLKSSLPSQSNVEGPELGGGSVVLCVAPSEGRQLPRGQPQSEAVVQHRFLSVTSGHDNEG